MPTPAMPPAIDPCQHRPGTFIPEVCRTRQFKGFHLQLGQILPPSYHCAPFGVYGDLCAIRIPGNSLDADKSAQFTLRHFWRLRFSKRPVESLFPPNSLPPKVSASSKWAQGTLQAPRCSHDAIKNIVRLDFGIGPTLLTEYPKTAIHRKQKLIHKRKSMPQNKIPRPVLR